MNDRIYADHAATTFLSNAALDAMIPYLKENFGNPSSIHSFGEDAAKAVSDARRTISETLNCDTNGIVFTSGGSEADNHAISIIKSYALENDRPVFITSSAEHHAVMLPSKELEKYGISVITIDPDADGKVSPVKIREICDKYPGNVCGGSFMLANNETGSISDITEIAGIIHDAGGLCHTDGVQAVGHVPVDFEALGVDMLSLSAHKFHGPKGIGALIVTPKIHVNSFILGGAQESGRRAGTENVAGIIGMAVALFEAMSNLKSDSEKVAELRQMLLDGLLSYGAVVNGGGLPGILSVRFNGCDGEALVRGLDLFGIAVSAGAACNSKDVAASHVLLSMGLSESEAASTVRFSLDASNTKEEIHRIIEVIGDLL